MPAGYVAHLAIDPAKPTFHGTIEITGDLAKPATVIWVHGKGFTVHEAKATSTGVVVPLIAKSGGDFVELRAGTTLAAGRWVIALDYDGAIDQTGFAGAYRQKYGDDVYVSTQFEATAARLVFPCFDEPGFKVPWQLTLDVPLNQVAISNTPALRTDPIDRDHVRVEFAKTRPLPSYLIAFAVGPWELVDAGKGKSGVQLRVVVPKGQAARAAYAAESFPKIVGFLEDWFAIPYPYPKLDVIAVPSLRGGAMENAGMITYDSRYLLLDPLHPTWADRHGLINVLGHETSHQWFGDLVTNAWWDDVWLNESFATWMEDMITQAFDPSWHDDQFHVSTRTYAFNADSVATARKIRQPIETEDDIHNAFDGITYPKGSSVMRMFEHYVGTDVARKAIHLYLVKHADGSGTAADLIAALDEASGKKLEAAFGSFLDQAGVPILETALVCDKGKPPRVTVSQRRYLPVGAGAPGTNLWQMPVCVAYDKSGSRAETCAMIEGATAEIVLDATTCPKWSFPDADGFGYYRLALTEAQAKALRDVAWPKLTEPERRSAFEAVRVLALDGRLAITTLASFVPKMLAFDDRYGVGDALGDATSGTYGGNARGLPVTLGGVIPPPLHAAAQSRVRTIVGPLVKKLGLAPRAGETFDGEARRNDAVSSAAWANDRTIEHEAVTLAQHYRELAPSLRRLVLPVAANASPEIAAKLNADAIAEIDPQLRQEMLHALGGIHDHARLRAELDLMLDPKLTAEDALALMFGYGDEDGRADVEAWLRAHMDAIKARMPSAENEDFPIVISLIYPFTGACDPARRDDIAAYVTKQFATIATGARPVAQAIERMDECIARRKLLEPAIKAWLGQ